MKTLLKWVDRIMTLDEALGIIAFFGLFLVSFSNVFMRFVFDAPLAWSEEILKLLLVWCTFLGASALVRRNEHILISLVTDKLPANLNRWNNYVFNLGVIIVSATVILIYSIKLLPLSIYRSTPILHIPYYWVYLSMPVSAVMMIYHALHNGFVTRGE